MESKASMTALATNQPTTALEHASSLLQMDKERRRIEIMKLVRDKEPCSFEPRSKNDKRMRKIPPPMFAPFRDYVLAKSKRGTKTSQHTLDAYQRALEVLIDFANTKGISIHRPADEFDTLYALYLEGRYSPAAQKQHRAAVVMFYKFLRWAGVSEFTPFVDVESVSDPVRRADKNHPFSDSEIAAMLKHADATERALVLLGAHGGLRIAEILALTWADVEGGIIQVKNGKGGKNRDVPMSEPLRAAVDALPHGEGAIFTFTATTARARLKALCKRAKVEYTYKGTGGMHRLRHSAGFRMYSETKSPIHTARFLGHADEQTVSVYADKDDTLIRSTVGNW